MHTLISQTVSQQLAGSDSLWRIKPYNFYSTITTMNKAPQLSFIIHLFQWIWCSSLISYKWHTSVAYSINVLMYQFKRYCMRGRLTRVKPTILGSWVLSGPLNSHPFLTTVVFGERKALSCKKNVQNWLNSSKQPWNLNSFNITQTNLLPTTRSRNATCPSRLCNLHSSELYALCAHVYAMTDKT